MATIKEIELKIKEKDELFVDIMADLGFFVGKDEDADDRQHKQDLLHKLKKVQEETMELHQEMYLAQMRELSQQDEEE